MENENGQIILKAMQELNEPTTITKIIHHVSGDTGSAPGDIEKAVKETVQAGVRYGYVQKKNGKYCIPSADSCLESISDAGLDDDDAMQDRAVRGSGRRRRHRKSPGRKSSSRTRKTSRSRSRRRRQNM